MTYYEVWDLGSRNMLADFDGEDEALSFVCDLIDTGAAAWRTDLALNRLDSDHRPHRVASGADLVRLANDHRPRASVA